MNTAHHMQTDAYKSLERIIQYISETSPFQQLVADIKQNKCESNCLRLPRATRLPVILALHKELNQPILVIVERADQALTILDEIAVWDTTIPRLYFPEPNPLFYENASWGVTTRRDRLLALSHLALLQTPGAHKLDKHPIIIASARAVMTRTLPRREFIKNTISIKPGKVISPEKLTRHCVKIGYEPSNIVVTAGQFARRGGILDIWPPAEQSPLRIEFFGDEVDTIREFDPGTQRTKRSIDHFTITPAREFIQPENSMLPEGEDYTEFYIPLIHKSEASILDYLPNKAITCIEDEEAFEYAVNDTEMQAVKTRDEFIKESLLDPNYPIPYLTWEQLQERLNPNRTLILGPINEPENPDFYNLRALFQPNPRFGGQLKPLFHHINQLINAKCEVFVVSRQRERLTEVWKDIQSRNLPAQPYFINGSLAEGWMLELSSTKSVALLTDGEIFGWRKLTPRRRHRPVAESPEAQYADLNPGDYVVHVDHGIGVFKGLVNRTIDGIEREYLLIEYAENDQLYVPIHQADRVTRYIGPDSRLPKLTRLGGAEWHQVKSKVKQAVADMAEELLELYAKRSLVKGHAFSPDTEWQKELEASFPYIETEDQTRVIAEVKRDMESPKPMDRLICGDVGYGKTEVALRAAFKAVMDGKQVAILVPTTVLAQQHYDTFRQRLMAFPVEVEMLSRFRTPQQQRKIINKLARGKIDIIIGTHRLLSSDVTFKDLGLLIIDEEQRFGVTHKEQLKKLRTEIDVLTMTATPIPRTLYMTLTGVRDISTINTPPDERLPVITHVGPYQPKLIRRAIMRELERGGQVFFVHNRVQTIRAMEQHLEKLVPEARIVVAHGQMPEKELSRIMRLFSEGDADVLLSTSIIESGLDIPNANTLIVDRADTFGLAQLYQLRGRVGRGAQRAYAYFFRHPKRIPTPEGRERLETIAENTQLGAGFSIAMRDLEIRGTGDILGTRQHGHIAAVGFHLYTRLLSEAIHQLKRKQKGDAMIRESASIFYKPIINVDLPLDAHIPNTYIPDLDTRLSLYRRIAEVKSVKEVEALQIEFKDRFGDPPPPVLNLFAQLKIKIYAENAKLLSVSTENGKIVCRFEEENIGLYEHINHPAVRVGKNALWIERNRLSESWLEDLLNILTRITGH